MITLLCSQSCYFRFEFHDQSEQEISCFGGEQLPKIQYELHGCINDVVAMSDVVPTGANIKAALSKMVSQAETGDVLFFHYSGHGPGFPSLKPAHIFRQDEAIVPSDFNLITGNVLLLQTMPERSKFHDSIGFMSQWLSDRQRKRTNRPQDQYPF
ncbi:hypothetical protein GQ457_01G048470 [Hibiscus cannabinus]